MNRDKSLSIAKQAEPSIFRAAEFISPVLERGEGTFVWDVDGNRYMDINSGQFCTVLGHNHPELNAIVSDQMARLTHTSTMTLSRVVIDAARDLAEINDGDLKKVLFLSTGAEANETALRYAKFITGRQKVISLTKGYHGLTVGTQSLTMEGLWSRPIVEGSLHVETPDLDYLPDGDDRESCVDRCLEDLRTKLRMHHDEVAAVILEPMLGAGGMIILPPRYIQGVRDLCSETGALMILDECQTGFARTGRWFAYQHYGVIPDILVLAKAIGAGFPVSAVVFRQPVAARIEGKITHFSSHQDDPLPARITSFAIDYIKKNGLLRSITLKGKRLLDGLSAIAERNPLLKYPRGLGLMVAFDLPAELVGAERRITADLINGMQDDGVLVQAVRKGITFRIMPSFLITDAELEEFLAILERNLDSLSKRYLPKAQ